VTIDTIKSLAIGFISPPTRPSIHEAMLAMAARSAIALYSTLRPMTTSVSVNVSGMPGADDKGSYREFQIQLTTGILYASAITVSGDLYQHRLVSSDATTAMVRVYGDMPLVDPLPVTIWRPVAHDPLVPTWSPHHEAIIALICAAFYLNALALQEHNAQQSDSIQNIASGYYGRATTMLSQLP
jgi:hypothetical protein